MADIKGLYIDNNTLKPSSSGGEGGSEVDFKGRTIHTLEKECMLSDFYIGSILDRDIIKENGSSYIYLNSHLIAEDLFPSYVDGYCFPKYPVEFKIFLNCLSSGTRCCSSGLCFVRNFEGDNEWYAECPPWHTSASSLNSVKNDILVKIILKYVGETKEDWWRAQGMR